MDITAKIAISTTSVSRNRAGGITAQRLLGTITATDTLLIKNRAHGLAILDSSFLPCILHQVVAEGNAANGLYLQRVAVKSNISDSIFYRNVFNGFVLENGAGEIEFQNITAVLNNYAGVTFHDGKASSKFLLSNLTRNLQDGCLLSNQGGTHQFFNCSANFNRRDGISLYDVTPGYLSDPPRHQFSDFILQGCVLNGNRYNGLKLGPACQHWSESAVNVTMTISNDYFSSNGGWGFFLGPHRMYCKLQGPNYAPRKSSAIVRENVFEENSLAAFYVYCMGFLGLDAVIAANQFIKQTSKVLTLTDDSKCGAHIRTNPVNVEIRRNNFLKNQAENVLYIDFSSFSETRSATIDQNT